MNEVSLAELRAHEMWKMKHFLDNYATTYNLLCDSQTELERIQALEKRMDKMDNKQPNWKCLLDRVVKILEKQDAAT